MMNAQEKFDPFTLEVIQNSFQAASEEMFAVLRKVAMSSVIYENLDFGVAVTDGTGRLASQGSGLPGFIGMLDSGVKAVLGKFGREQIAPGDIFVSNDPYSGGVSHLNDVVLSLPVFVDAEIVAWMVNKAHWSDVGGMSPGSLSTETVEVYQEGLQLPDIKLFEQGEINQAVVDIIVSNCRLPQYTLGDMWAGIAALRAGERRTVELVRRYGRATVLEAIEQHLDYGEAAARRALQELPRGRYEAQDWTEDSKPTRVVVEITEEAFIVDLRGNPVQDTGPFNCPWACTWSAAQMVFNAVTDPGSVSNEGTFRPLKLLCDEGSIFHCKRPAPVSIYFEPLLHAMDLIWKALAPHVPERLPAGQMNSVSGIIIAGVNPDTDEFQVMIEPNVGGWGARHDRDGQNGQMSGASGETFNCPVEIREARHGVIIEGYGFHDLDGGEGKYRGGKGIFADYRIRSEEAWLTGYHTRGRHPPWGMNSGREGSLNFTRIYRNDGSVDDYTRATNVRVECGDLVRIYTANGGGYGDPRERPREQLLEDISNEFVTREQAEKYYGLRQKEVVRGVPEPA